MGGGGTSGGALGSSAVGHAAEVMVERSDFGQQTTGRNHLIDLYESCDSRHKSRCRCNGSRRLIWREVRAGAGFVIGHRLQIVGAAEEPS